MLDNAWLNYLMTLLCHYWKLYLVNIYWKVSKMKIGLFRAINIRCFYISSIYCYKAIFIRSEIKAKNYFFMQLILWERNHPFLLKVSWLIWSVINWYLYWKFFGITMLFIFTWSIENKLFVWYYFIKLEFKFLYFFLIILYFYYIFLV